jgi:hypothetical protein
MKQMMQHETKPVDNFSFARKTAIFNPEDVDNMFLQNVGINISVYTAS